MGAPTRQAYLQRLRLLRDCAAQGMTAEQAAQAVGVVPGTLRRTLAQIEPGLAWPPADAVLADAVAKQEAWINQVCAEGGAWQPTVRQRHVVALAEQVFDLMPGVILSGSRMRRVVFARQAAALVLLRCWPGISTSQVGVVLDVDHSSICTARDRAEALELADPAFATQVFTLRQLVEAQAVPVVLPVAAVERPRRPRQIERAPLLVERTAAEKNRALLAGMLGTRKGRGMGEEALPEDAVLTARAIAAGSAALLEAIRREHPEKVAA